MSASATSQHCEICGCTEARACVTEDGPCHWVRPGLCSACAGFGMVLQPLDMEALAAMPPVRCALDGLTAFCLVAAIQLACRHEKFVGPSREVVEDFARGLGERIAITPHLQQVIEAGWDPGQDVPPAPEDQRTNLILPGDPGWPR